MKKITLGTTGIEISVMGLGTMYFGSNVDERTSFLLMDLYLEHGGNFIDSANKYASWLPGYQGGESESFIGKWLRQSGRHGDLILSSKVGFPYGEVPRSLKKEIIISECEKSLARLGVETIDLYFAHAYDEHTPIEETMEAFYSLKKAGKIRYAGASNFTGWRLEEANSAAASQQWEGYCCLQQRHTYLEPAVRADFGNQLILTPEIADLCRKRELTLMAYSSNQLVLSWMLHSSPPVIPLVTGSNEHQLKENLEAASVNLTLDDMESLDRPVIEPNKY